MSYGLGKCGICFRNIDEATPIDHVLLGVPKRAYVCHKTCKPAPTATLPPPESLSSSLPTPEQTTRANKKTRR